MGLLDTFKKEARETPPDGAFTIEDVVATGRYKRAHARVVIREKVRAGELLCKAYVVNGRRVNYYMEKKK